MDRLRLTLAVFVAVKIIHAELVPEYSMPFALRSKLVLAMAFALLLPSTLRAGSKDIVKYCRFQAGKTVAYGIVDGETVRELEGDLFGDFKKTEKTYPLKDVKLLVPTRPTQVLALAGNYKSHLNDSNAVTTVTTVTTLTTNGKTGETKSETKTSIDTVKSGDIPEKFQIPQPFFKSPSCLIANDEKIVLPKDSQVVHFEAELVIVIGRKAKKVSKEKAHEYILGVTCGNDVSERGWQNGGKKDIQWWRAKGADTFGPVGPMIVSGLDYDDLLLTLRLNGEVKQKERTSQFIQDVPSTVSFISQYITLEPGDMIFTGTPGRTSEIKAGDIVEVELEGVGVLRNPVVAGQ